MQRIRKILRIPKSIGLGILANIYGQTISLVIQILSIPVFLYIWPIETYGKWLVIYAIPSYLSMMDLGIGTIASNSVVMSASRNQSNEANNTFHTAIAFSTISATAIGILAYLAVHQLNIFSLESDLKTALFILCIATCAGMFSSIFEIPFRARNQYHIGVIATNSMRLSEWIAMIVGAAIFGTFTAAAIGFIIGKVSSLLVTLCFAKPNRSGLNFGIQRASRSTLISLVKPGVWYLMLPLANALQIQGMTLAIASGLGTAAVVQFNTFRTISRVCLQATGVISHSFWVNFSKLFAERRKSEIYAMYKNGTKLTLTFSLIVFAGIIALGEPILALWTSGKVSWNFPLFALLMLSALAGSAWHLARVLLLATNNHEAIAKINLALSISLVILATVAAKESMIWIGILLVAVEMTMIYISQRLVNSLIFKS